MATFSDWVEGARLRTLPAAAAPVCVGACAAAHLGSFSLLRSALALAVALFLQVGVNYANDYSDGVRGTDEHRVGPQRLTGGGLASPRQVLAAALGCFAAAGILGLTLVALSGTWWLIAAGACAVVAAWFYTGGRRPYGYMGVGLSELMVFMFFGLMAGVGTTWTQAYAAPWWLWIAASCLGLLSVAMLMVNNIRDIATDTVSGKRTLAVRMGDRGSRLFFAGCVWVPIGVFAVLAAVVDLPFSTFCAVVAAMLYAMAACSLSAPVLGGAQGRDLIRVLKHLGLVTLGWALLVSAFLVLG